MDWAKCTRCDSTLEFDHDPGSMIQSTCPKCGHITFNYETNK